MEPQWPGWEAEEDDAGFEFHQEDVVFELDQAEAVAEWLSTVAKLESRPAGAVNIIFCSDAYLHEMNVRYLDHDTLTDVITFPYAEGQVAGDIFISIDRVRENAATYGVALREELDRVMVHGVLHLAGYDDQTPEAKAAMREREDVYLARRGYGAGGPGAG